MAMHAVLTQAGVNPDYLLGHSVGELTAAHVAGVLSLEEAAVLVCARGRLMQSCTPGAMMAISASEPAVAAMLENHPEVVIAAVNGPTSVAVAGPAEQLNALREHCNISNHKVTLLRVSHAFHSPAMDPILAEFEAIAERLTYRPHSVPIMSNLTGSLATVEQLTSARYWAQHLRKPVRFYDGVTRLLAGGEQAFVELSPHPVLAAAITDTLTGVTDRVGSAVVTTLRRDRPDMDMVASAIANLHVHGHSPSWQKIYPGATTVELPTYAFQHRRYWLDPAPRADVSAAGLDQPEHPLLAAVTELADQDQIVLSGRLSTSAHRWLAGHQLGDTVVLPATALIDMALYAGEHTGCPTIDELVLQTPLTLTPDAATDLQISVAAPDEQNRRTFSVHARTSEHPHQHSTWVLHASGTLSNAPSTTPPTKPLPGPQAITKVNQESFYDQLAQHGLHYSEAFRSIQGIGKNPLNPDAICAEVALPADIETHGYGIHPALLDAALHPLTAALADTNTNSGPQLPFAIAGITLHATGASRMHVQLEPTATDTFRLSATDPVGAPVITIDSLTVRSLPDTDLTQPPTHKAQQGIFELTWPALPAETFPATGVLPPWALISPHPENLSPDLNQSPTYPNLTALPTCPPLVIWDLTTPQPPQSDLLHHVHTLTQHTLAGLQNWLNRSDTLQAHLVVLTRHAVTTSPHDLAPDPAQAATAALIHTTQNEHPNRITLIDIDNTPTTSQTLTNILTTLTNPTSAPTEPQLALRHGTPHTPRLTPTQVLTPPAAPNWELATTGKGDLANLALLPTPPHTELGPGQIRVAVRAAGLNFRDVVVALGAIGEEGLGGEAAGIIIDTGPDVTAFRRGDAVMGLFPNNAFAATAVTDHRMVVPIPAGWSFAAAASIPVAFLTAYGAMVELGALAAGRRVLIHAGAGGVGQAAIQIARHFGAEVYATAHPSKHHVLKALGVSGDRIASSRTFDFVDVFNQGTNGEGMDLVLNSLAGDFVDNSLRLLSQGGRLIEIGKTDIRVPNEVAAAHPGVIYRTYDLSSETPDRISQLWAALIEMISAGVLRPLPTTSYGLLQATQALRHMSQGRHTGKIVLLPPGVFNSEGTVLVTGGTGMLGGVFAERLVAHYGARHLLLVSRSGPDAAGADELYQRLTQLGAQVTITACDTSNPDELAAVLAGIPPQHPLRAVVHTAGIVDDAVTTELTHEQLDTVLTAKADTAWHLHQLTTDADLDAFVVFSSVAGVLGAPGQANYAAANAFLDALAHQRHRDHLPATSLAWGYWQTTSGITAHLDTVDQARLTRNSLTPITTEHGLAMFDVALACQHPCLVPAPLNTQVLAGYARQNALPAILSAVTTTRRQATTTNTETFTSRLASQTPQQQLAILTDLVTDMTAAVLAHPDSAALDADLPFKDLGIDSLSALELRNSLARHTGLTLSATLVFDHPTPTAIAHHLVDQLSAAAPPAPVATPVKANAEEPVVVVGMACRLPGGIESAAGLWDVVSGAADVMGAFPTDRGWDVAGLFDPDPDSVGKTYTRYGGFISSAAEFDAEFFGISAREAAAMDPQQRVLLEVCWEALEHAGIEPGTLEGSNTGVFIGAYAQRYGDSDSDSGEGFALTGGATSVASGRVAYVLGLQGPAITVDTACSSSLVATHLACQSLRNGESSLALAGGVTIMATPAPFIEFARQRGLAADGRCKAFAAAADGTGWGEGAAVLVLERLSDARRNRHPVLAVIAGSAVNQDGASNGLSAPNGPAQQRVIAQAAANAGIALDQVDVVEAHGTGTTLGDPIEAGALIATYGTHRDPEHPLWLGSVKSNIGHTQAAAGAAGLIKMIQAMRHGVLPKTLHVNAPTPQVDWSAGTVRLLTETMPWPDTDHLRTAAVSSFGVSGTNAHLIVQQGSPGPAVAVHQASPSQECSLGIWPLSARSSAGLSAQAHRLHEYLLGHSDLDLIDLAYSLATTRTHHSYRAAVTVPGCTDNAHHDLLGGLTALAAGQTHPFVANHYCRAGQNGKTVFVFPGQGGQYPAMAAEFYRQHPGFATAVDECDAELRPYTGWSVRDVICQDPDAPSLELVEVIQPVLFAVMIALAETLRGYGIVPDAVIGHSQGEIAAAYIAGALTLAEAAKVVALRSAALAQLAGTGTMASVLLSPEELRPLLQPWNTQISIAAINGPAHTIISGDTTAVDQFIDTCEDGGVQIRPIAVDYASHSAHVERLREHLLHELADLNPQPARIPLYSTVASELSEHPLDTTAMDADYWYRNLREPVQFYSCVAQLLAHSERVFVELSPHPVLASALTDALADAGQLTQSAVVTTLRRDRPDMDMVANAIANLHVHGHSPSWQKIYPGATTVELPTYPFQRRRYWLAAPTPTPATVSDPAEVALWDAVNDDAVDTVAQVLRIDNAQSIVSLGPVVRALREWRKDLRDRSVVGQLRYQVGWRNVTPNTFPQTRRRWLVLTLPEQSDDVWVAGFSARFADSVAMLTIDPHMFDRNSLAALLADEATRNKCDGIVSFMALHARTDQDFPGISTALLSTLHIVQSYGDSGLDLPLWVITQGGAQVNPDDVLTPSQSAVWGLGQSACLEHPTWWGGLVDLPVSPTPQDFNRLQAILTCQQSEDQLAIRAAGVSARRLHKASLPQARMRTWKVSGTALVTGVTGHLGQHIARWLAQAGASHLVLLSRTAAEHPQVAELEKELNSAGITTTSISVDVTDRDALAAVVAETRTEHGPIHTIVHAAAHIGLVTTTETTIDEFTKSFAAKALGAENLIAVLEDQPPQTFIMFSSAAATWGGTRQGAYAAANAYIEALVTRLRGRGCHAIAPAWGAWTDDRTTSQEVVGYFSRIGLHQISPDIAFAALQQSLDVDDTLITIADVDWSQFRDIFTTTGRAHTLLAELGTTQPQTAEIPAITENSHYAAQLAKQTPQQQLTTLIELVTTVTAAVLAHPDPAMLDPDLSFKDLGIDSLSALELRNTLTRDTGLTLPATLVFDHPTPTAVAEHLLGLLRGVTGPTLAVVPTRVGVDVPVAVVGMACRLPGGIESAAGLWDVVSNGIDVMSGFPLDRGWDVAGLFDPDPDAEGKTYTRYGGFVADVAGFDAEFFGISAREAITMDPQQRVLLEVCWQALEHAGIDPTTLEGSDTGVFVGIGAQSYVSAHSGVEGYALTGASASVASGRVAYVLGLQGPAITVDTACSSSLVATHLACQSLRNGESSLALSGGVTIMATPTPFIEFARQRGLAADGRCKAFAAAADGTGWGEGAAVLVLERLSDARRNRHPVLAVIAGSAVNQDGASNGLSAPNGPAQQRVIAQAAANAGIALDQVDVVEAHGTGTTLGDPIEAGALIATYGTHRDPEHPLWLGSVKSNIGHTQHAAGAAGLIKMIQALNHAVLPATLHIDQPSPHIDWSTDTVRLLTEATPWPETEHLRTGAVSAFGVSGTNAHLIVQQAPPEVFESVPEPETAQLSGQPLLRIWPVSAHTPAALTAQAERLSEYLTRHEDLSLTDLAYSLACTRTHHPYRAAVTVPVDTSNPGHDLAAALRALAANQPHPYVTCHHYRARQPSKTVFVFPGQGGQYPAMAAEFYRQHPGFATAVDECDAELRPYTGWSVRDVICQDPDAPSLELVEVIQPVLFAVMIALAETLRGYGIVPDAVIGHSQGEIAAAYIAGALTLAEAAKVVALRSAALAQLAGTGTMASVLLSPEELRPLLQPWNTQISIAAINGPAHTIISGDITAVEQFIGTCEDGGVQIRPIAVDYASHSAHVERLREHLLHELADLNPQPARIPLYSTVASELSEHPLDTTAMDAEYWYRNLREPVEFYSCVAQLLAHSERVFVELSPHPVLASALTDALADAGQLTQSAVVTTLRRDRPDMDMVASAIANLHVHGHSPSWQKIYPGATTVELPTYPFQHRRYWLDPAPRADVSAAGLDQPEHPLLAAVTELADQDQIVLSGRLSTSVHRWLAGHQLGDTVVLPATALIDMALYAGEHTGCPTIDELVLQTPLTLTPDAATDLQISVAAPDEQNRRTFSVHARTSEHPHQHSTWVLHASGTLSNHPSRMFSPTTPFAAGRTPNAVDQDSFYEELAQHGVRYDGAFRALHSLENNPSDTDTTCAEVALPADTDVDGYGIHPALLDAALQPLAAAFTDTDTDAPSAATPRMPFVITGVNLHATGARRLLVHLTATDADTFSLHATDPAGATVITINAVTLRALTDIGSLRPSGISRRGLLELAWPALPPDTFSTAAVLPPLALVSSHSDDLAHALGQSSQCAVYTDLAAVQPCPPLVLWDLTAGPDSTPTPEDGDTEDPLQRVHTLTRHTLAGLQNWLNRSDTTGTHLVILTRRAVTTVPHDLAPDPAHAATWAFAHSAQNEHPNRITLIDIDNTPATSQTLTNILTTLTNPTSAPTEPQLALRHGTPHTPRLTPTTTETTTTSPPLEFDPAGTVLITGGTGMLGAVFAEHMIARYGARHLLLVSRSGPDAPGADD
ncbi:type I polyketide synthase, partial [Mycobacterium marinum]|uniref:type I polyketide synthase n=1 Tax=Mycobacterium marinum TaxID=1781 RepID=UPI002358CC8C